MVLEICGDSPSFSIPSEIDSVFLEAESSFILCFSVLPFDDLLFLLTHLLLETPLIINSENQALLGATILTLLALMKPFKWPFPIIFSLHQDMSDLVDTPSPIVLGLNHSFVFTEELYYLKSPREDAIFVDLDFCKFRTTSSCLDIYKKISLIKDLGEVAEKYKAHFNDKPANFAKKAMTNTGSRGRTINSSIIYAPTETHMKAGKEIVRMIYSFLCTRYVRTLPSKPIYMESDKPGGMNQIDMAKTKQHILQNNPTYQKHFLNRFLSTQMFEMFTTSHYRKFS